MGRFISTDCVMGTNASIASYNLLTYCGNNPVVRSDSVGTSWEDIISGIIHAGNDILIFIGLDTAAIGAVFLDMYQDSSGVYHAEFDCWQQYFGYNDLYDVAFDIGTSMVVAKFTFTYIGIGFTIWVWKGDYINLGAGAELGIYLGDKGHRTVSKGLAMQMAMCVAYKQAIIIEHYPDQYQWWITGFNPAYQNVNADDLTVCFLLRFRGAGMYFAFKNSVCGDSRWTFYDGNYTAVFLF